MTEYQPYWVAYAAAQGRTPAEQDAHDRHPDGTFRGYLFMAWIDVQWREFGHPVGEGGIRDHVGFGEWLAARYLEQSKRGG